MLPRDDKMLVRPHRPKFATSLASSSTNFFRGSTSQKNTDLLPNLSPRGMSEDPKYQPTLTLIQQKSSGISQRSTLLSRDLTKRRETYEGLSTFKLDGEISSPKKKKKVLKLKTKKNTTLLEGLRKMYLSPRNIQSSSVKTREI